MEAAIDGLVKFMAAHSAWAFWIAMAFAFAENLAFLSLAIPSTAVLVAVGALVATGELSFTPIFIGASGVLTQNPSTSGLLRRIAWAVSATAINVDIMPPVLQA